MNVVIITTREEIYHQYLCVELARRHNVVGVIHPRPKRWTRADVRQARRRDIQTFGLTYYVLRKLARNRYKTLGWDEQADLEQAQRRFFPDAAEAYRREVAPRARDVDDVNAPEAVDLLRSLQPDAVVCSGGPIYREPLIRAAGLMLNFHTGISPLYNGAYTVYWTYANRQPHLTGGTLMLMSPVVDGGDILAHFLPDVEAGDTPATQFMKCIAGGVRLYDAFLTDRARSAPFTKVPQGRPFLNYRDSDWSVCTNLAIARHIRNKVCKKFVRGEIVRKYWDLGDAEAAREAVRGTLLELVYHA
jgi:folate-dependent phosphoribosylglycinamide formyltransferase PurN